jgi:hypothetical protein
MRSQKDDLEFGKASEERWIPCIQEHLGVYMMPTHPTCVVDWVECVPTEETIPLVAELKSRTISYEYCRRRFGDAPIGKNKIDYMRGNGDGFIYMAFTDGLYYIRYDEDLFKGFRIDENYKRFARSDCKDSEKATVFIPCNLMERLDA